MDSQPPAEVLSLPLRGEDVELRQHFFGGLQQNETGRQRENLRRLTAVCEVRVGGVCEMTVDVALFGNQTVVIIVLGFLFCRGRWGCI